MADHHHGAGKLAAVKRGMAMELLLFGTILATLFALLWIILEHLPFMDKLAERFASWMRRQ